MATEEQQKKILGWIDDIESDIQEIYYIEQFEFAKNIEKRLSNLKEQLSEDTDINGYDLNKTDRFVREIVEIENIIKRFFEEKGSREKKKVDKNIFQNKINEIISNLKEKISKQSFEDLSLVIKEYNEDKLNEMEKRERTEKITRTVLEILKSQVIKGEEIDIEEIEEFCTQEDLIKAIKSELIEKAQIQNEEDRISTLEMARKLMPEDLKMPNIWRKLTQVEHLKIANSIEESKEKCSLDVPKAEEKYLPNVQPDVLPKQWNWETIKESVLFHFYDTKFVLGEIEQKTGEYKNVKVKYCNLENFDKIQPERVLEMKTRAETIEKHKFWSCENLRKIELLDEVTKIEPEAFWGCEELKELKLGKGLRNIPKACFRNAGLEKLHIPGNVQKIGDHAFSDCPIKEVIFEDGLEEIGRYAFLQTEFEQVKIPKSTKKIGERAFVWSRLKIMQILGDGAIEIDKDAIWSCFDVVIEVEHNKEIKGIEDLVCSGDGIKLVRVENSGEKNEKLTGKNARKSEFDKQYKVEQTPTINTRTSYQYNEIETPSNPKKTSNGREH